MLFKGFSIFSSGGYFVQLSRTIFAILVEGYPRNIPVNLFKIHSPWWQLPQSKARTQVQALLVRKWQRHCWCRSVHGGRVDRESFLRYRESLTIILVKLIVGQRVVTFCLCMPLRVIWVMRLRTCSLISCVLWLPRYQHQNLWSHVEIGMAM